jgi:hypothetical protein
MGSSMRNALLLCTLGVAAGALLAVAAFACAASFALFALVFAAAQLAMFVSQVGPAGPGAPAGGAQLCDTACLPACCQVASPPRLPANRPAFLPIAGCG